MIVVGTLANDGLQSWIKHVENEIEEELALIESIPVIAKALNRFLNAECPTELDLAHHKLRALKELHSILKINQKDQKLMDTKTDKAECVRDSDMTNITFSGYNITEDDDYHINISDGGLGIDLYLNREKLIELKDLVNLMLEGEVRDIEGVLGIKDKS